ncbi:MAG: PAS domain S-box protein, partial [Chloroflexota bacterium]|nr:PAS domain S-box protein [Chloroflexota bacterium]
MNEIVRVLYVDDYPLDRELVRDALEREHGDFHLTEAASRQEFEARLAEGNYDVVLSDFNILGFEGLQVLDAIRAKDPGTPVMIVTGTGSEEIAVEAMKRGANDYVIKTPAHIQRLPHIIHNALEHKRLEDERRRAEEALRESEIRYRTLFESVPLGIGLATLDGRVLESNDAMLQITGYSMAELQQVPLADIYENPGERELLVQQIQADGCVRGFETRLKRKDGTSYHVSLNVTPFKLGGEDLFLTVAEDITERKLAEEKLRRANRALRVLSDGNQAVVRATDESALLHEMCRTIVEVGGYHLAWVGFAEQDEKKTVRPVAQAGYEEGYLDTVNVTWADNEQGRGPTGTAIRTGEPVIASNILTDPDFDPWRAEATKRGYASSIALPLIGEGWTLGALNVYSVEANAFDVEEVKMLMELANDLAYGIVALRTRAERRRAEEALKRSEERYDLAQRAANVGSWDWNVLTGGLRWSDQIEPMFGLERGEFGGTYEAFLGCVHPEDRQRVIDAVNACVEEGQKYNIEHRVVWPDGTVRWVLETGDAVRGDDGKAIRMLGVAQDITERKRAEEALRRERDLVARITETSPVGIAVVNHEGQITFANERAEQVLGLTRDEIVRRTYNEPEWRITDYEGKPFPDDELPFRRVMSTGQPVRDVRHAIERPDGRRVLLSINSAPLFDDAGQLDGIVAALEDITERIRAEKTLRRARREWEDIFQAIGHPTVILDPQHGVIAANRATTKAVGRPLEDILGAQCYEIFHEADHYPDSCPLEKMRVSGHLETVEMEMSVLGGAFLVSCTPVLDDEGHLEKVIHIASNITERVRAEEALRESQRTLSTLMSNLPGMAYRCLNVEDWTMEFVSEGCFGLTGYPPSDLIGSEKVSYADLIHPDDRGLVWENVQGALEEGMPFEVLYRLIPANGEEKWVWERGQAVSVSEEGSPILEGFVSDITERKQAEEALSRRVQQLAALSKASQAVTASLELDQVLAEIVSLAGDVLSSDYTSVVLVDETAQIGRSAEHIPGLPSIKYRVRDGGLTDWIVRSRRVVIIDEIGEDGTILRSDLGSEAPRRANPLVAKAGVKSAAGLP